MSFTTVEQVETRLNRSELAVPGSQPSLFEKAARSAADIVFLDLEDSVAPDDKSSARKKVIAAIADVDWGRKSLSVRINGLDTPYMYRDVVDLLENSSERLDLIMIPKVGTAADVYALDMLCTQIETAKQRKKRVGFELIIESALGMQNIEAIAVASKRTESLHFGVADYSASIRSRTTSIGGANSGYSVLTDPDDNGNRNRHWGDMWHYALARLVVAARANGLRPVDGPFGSFSDDEGFRSAARRAAALGCDGKWAIHPGQVSLANDIMSPSEAEVAHAKRIMSAMAEAAQEGRGAVSLDGKLIDYASLRQAEVVVSKAKFIAGA
jgi:malyl-CoA/(S)-citramalyl-CoA lyase